MLESSLALSENERHVLQDKIRDLQDAETRQKETSNALRTELEAASKHRNKLELKLKALDGELQRAKKINGENDVEIRDLRERLSITMREKQVTQKKCRNFIGC